MFTQNKSLLIGGLLLIVLAGSCNTIRPFFIKNKKKEERKEKRTVKKIARKEDKIIKKQEKVADMKIGMAKSDSTLQQKKDTLLKVGPDTAYAHRIINQKKIQYTTFQCKAKNAF